MSLFTPVGRLTPDGFGRFHNQSQFPFLIFRRDPITDGRARKATLGAQGQPIERQETTSLSNPRRELIAGFMARGFRGDQPQDDDLIFGDFPERLERARADIIVLEQQTLDADVVEDALGDGLVSSNGQPPAALVAPSEVKPKGHLRKIADDGVVHLDALLYPAIETPSLRLVEGAGFRIDQQPIMRRIDLDIGGAQSD